MMRQTDKQKLMKVRERLGLSEEAFSNAEVQRMRMRKFAPTKREPVRAAALREPSWYRKHKPDAPSVNQYERGMEDGQKDRA
jgi:hypothetical protein